MSPMNIRVRMIVLIVFIAVATALCGIRLMKIQIVDGEIYLEQSKYAAKGTQLIKAARGEIVDTNGVQIVKNKAGFNVIIEAAFFPKDYEEGNEIILRTAKILMEDNVERVESIPISKTLPYTYLPDRERDIKVMLDDEHLRLNVYATPDDCINALIERYKISDKYTTEEKRIIAGVRYEMLLRGFSVSNRYTFAVDVPVVTVSKIKELSYKLQGVDIAEEAVRVYAQSDILSHSIGTIGPIYAEEYEELKEEGYKLNDVLGKSGIEKFMEKELRGNDGTRTTLISGGKVISVTDTIPAVPGNTVKLTIDSDYQRDVQNILANHIKWLNMYSTEEKGKNAPIRWLQSLQESEFAMPVMDPLLVAQDYNPEVEDDHLIPLGEMSADDTLVLVTVTVPKDLTKMSVNLQAPIIINADSKKATQIIVNAEQFPIKYYIYDILQNRKKEGE